MSVNVATLMLMLRCGPGTAQCYSTDPRNYLWARCDHMYLKYSVHTFGRFKSQCYAADPLTYCSAGLGTMAHHPRLAKLIFECIFSRILLDLILVREWGQHSLLTAAALQFLLCIIPIPSSIRFDSNLDSEAFNCGAPIWKPSWIGLRRWYNSYCMNPATVSVSYAR